jgi:hypothetical protein
VPLELRATGVWDDLGVPGPSLEVQVEWLLVWVAVLEEVSALRDRRVAGIDARGALAMAGPRLNANQAAHHYQLGTAGARLLPARTPAEYPA